MANIKTLQTLPTFSRQIRVEVVSVHMNMTLDEFEAYAEVEEVYFYTLNHYCEPKTTRKGKVRLTIDAVKELFQNQGTSMPSYMVEESHIEWKV